MSESPRKPSPNESAKKPQKQPWDRFFLELGYSLTLGSAHPNMRAASLPGLLDPNDDPQTDGLPYNDAFIPPGTDGCTAPAGEYCVRVNESGASFAHGFHFGAGVFLTERFGLAARLRVAPIAGGGPMSNVLVGLRAHIRVTEPRRAGFHTSIFIGGMAGQVQLRPRQSPTPPATSIDRPFVRTGLGGAELGAKIGYRFRDNFGLFVSPEAYAMFTSVSFGGQVTIGADYTFGTVYPVEPEPEIVDTDGDGIEDSVDECPTEPETFNGYEDEDGCPDEVPSEPDPEDDPGSREPQVKPTPDIPGIERADDGRLRFRDPVRFRRNSHKLEPSSYAALDEIAETLRANPEITHIHIEGHADERGADIYNVRLSERRVDSVRMALIRRGGVSEDRISTEGFGWHRPVRANATGEAEHAENRRVELYITVIEE